MRDIESPEQIIALEGLDAILIMGVVTDITMESLVEVLEGVGQGALLINSHLIASPF